MIHHVFTTSAAVLKTIDIMHAHISSRRRCWWSVCVFLTSGVHDKWSVTNTIALPNFYPTVCIYYLQGFFFIHLRRWRTVNKKLPTASHIILHTSTSLWFQLWSHRSTRWKFSAHTRLSKAWLKFLAKRFAASGPAKIELSTNVWCSRESACVRG